ncbi:conserved hypothetical protein [Anaeromyxobacter dehalogenans 2CP-1]|uniref:Uncharacterized protein n=1 Tax=Anaeromyxobacter dehalogenans (strain ATCC BAA-258 / DSM 21875 / 2CP-1) TaxID=455488 RepID=B8J813_ANAD2|nr:hypothetical protein [Anaeromyxobacter dehalogenans]ACL63505.1 conserved hypothetical protein [Anaeromyxobacter dehalogenans 2CP-1]
MADETPRARAGSGVKALLAWVAILGLAGVVAWLASERNARTWYLVPDEGRLVVMKGLMLPMGRQAFSTDDPALAAAYAPLVPPPGKPLPAERAFEERSLLDQGLFDLLAGWAREEVATGDPARLERGLGYLGRAERLAGISPAQRDELGAIRAESGYHEARRLLERAAAELRDAAEKLRVTAGSRSSRAMDAQLLLKQLEPAVDATLGAIRTAARSEPAAAEKGAGPPPAAGEPAPAAAPEPGQAPAAQPSAAPVAPAGQPPPPGDGR